MVTKFKSLKDYIYPTMWIILAVLSLVSYILPFARYKSGKSIYQMSGLEFLFGKDIMGGSVHISPVTYLWPGVILAVGVLFVALISKRISPKISGKLIIVFGFVQVIVGVMFLVTATSILNDTKKPAVEYGIYMMILLAILVIAVAVIRLYQYKYLSVLDFMVLPGLAYILINNYLPLAGISLAFKKINFQTGIWNSKWVGFSNFTYLFTSSDAYVITRNTLLYNIAFIIVGNCMGILVGICLNEVFSKRLQKTYQTLILLPQLISMVIVSYIVYGFLSNESGFINMEVLNGDSINFYNNRAYWPFILIFVHAWKGLGYSSIIYLSSIIGIDRSLYEAARIDGCGRLSTIKQITLPLLKPTVFTLIMIQVGRIFYSDFGLFYQVPMNSGTLYAVTDTIDTYVYRSLMKLNNLSMASAASAYQAIVGFVIVLTFNIIVRKTNKENALF
jgi:ABC-type polysaccharide transport system permease subunit